MLFPSLPIRIFALTIFISCFTFTEADNSNWTPNAVEFDWVQLTSGEWLKGKIKSMYNEVLEFDSDKLKLQSIKLNDVKYLQSFKSCHISIENIGPVHGKLNIVNEIITVTEGDNIRKFKRTELISFTPAGSREIDLWAIKLSMGFDIKKGNTDQIDFNTQFSAKRRTAESRFTTNYTGNFSQTDAVSGSPEETINNQRINFSLDKYVTRYFFYTPIFGEYFEDKFQNIEQRTTLGVGIGYTLIDTDDMDWNISGGPSYLSTTYVSVLPGENIKADSASLALNTYFEAEINNRVDFIFKYNIQLSSKESGGYSHDMTATFETELTGDLDFDVSFIWRRINNAAVDDQGIAPEADDLNFILGISYTY